MARDAGTRYRGRRQVDDRYRRTKRRPADRAHSNRGRIVTHPTPPGAADPPSMSAGRTRVILADDHTLVRAGIRRILQSQPDIDVVAEAADGKAALDAVERQAADVLVLDLNMIGLEGIDVL